LRDRLRAAQEGVVKRILFLLSFIAALPTATDAAQGDDKAYCAQLSAMYRRYVQNGPGRRFDVEASRRRGVEVEASTALDDCSKGNTAAAIPVLETKLRESGFTLPEEFKP
jgi:hypothetical protein